MTTLLDDNLASDLISKRWEMIEKTVVKNPWIPKKLNGCNFPSGPQAWFLGCPHKEALYGGAAGGGKGTALLAAALQFVDYEGYSGLLLRRTFADLSKPGNLIPVSHEWLAGTKAKWDGSQHQWKFPSGSTLSFGYLDAQNDHLKYKSTAFDFVGFDELTTFPEHQYRYLFSRIRKPVNSLIPSRMRAATNPGDIGHDWVKARFILNAGRGDRIFIPAKLEDNPGLDKTAYEEMLAELDPVTRAQMRHGDWNIRPEGNLFKHEWFTDVCENPPELKKVVRSWDLAATEESEGADPDYTAGVKMGLDMYNTAYVLDVIRVRASPMHVQQIIKAAAIRDGRSVPIRIEQEPGASSKVLIAHLQRETLFGYIVRGVTSGKDKVTRAQAFSAAAEQGRVKICRANWNFSYIDELVGFPQANHDDAVDASTSAYNELCQSVQFSDLSVWIP